MLNLIFLRSILQKFFFFPKKHTNLINTYDNHVIERASSYKQRIEGIAKAKHTKKEDFTINKFIFRIKLFDVCVCGLLK